jgi:hypothetical protein
MLSFSQKFIGNIFGIDQINSFEACQPIGNEFSKTKKEVFSLVGLLFGQPI